VHSQVPPILILALASQILNNQQFNALGNVDTEHWSYPGKFVVWKEQTTPGVNSGGNLIMYMSNAGTLVLPQAGGGLSVTGVSNLKGDVALKAAGKIGEYVYSGVVGTTNLSNYRTSNTTEIPGLSNFVNLLSIDLSPGLWTVVWCTSMQAGFTNGTFLFRFQESSTNVDASRQYSIYLTGLNKGTIGNTIVVKANNACTLWVQGGTDSVDHSSFARHDLVAVRVA